MFIVLTLAYIFAQLVSSLVCNYIDNKFLVLLKNFGIEIV